MKFRVPMKTPDALDEAIWGVLDAAYAVASADEQDVMDEQQAHEHTALRRQCARWFKNDEQVTLEIDLGAGTCVVVENPGFGS